MNVTVTIDNETRFLAALERAKRETSDLRIPLTLIAKDFYKSEKAIFRLGSKGQYQDLKEKYKKYKQARVNFIYPILKFSGRLEGSVTSATHPDAISSIVNRDTLFIGTKVEYAGYHQFGTRKMAQRPFLFIGPEASRYATSDMMGRPERWMNILNSYVLSKLGALGDVTRGGINA